MSSPSSSDKPLPNVPSKSSLSPPTSPKQLAKDKKSSSSLLGPFSAKAPEQSKVDADNRSITSDGTEKVGKLKGFINRIRSNSSSSLSGEAKAILEKDKEKEKEKEKVKAKETEKEQEKPYYLGPSNLKPEMGPFLNDDDPFHAAVSRAEIAVSRLETTQLVVQGIVGITELGAGWIPGVGKGIAVVGQMLARATEIGIGRVAALRLVERSAAVLNAVQQAVIDNKGHVSPIMQKNIERLLGNLDDSAYVLTKLANRPFLKLYLHADETQRKIDKATDDLMDTLMIFQIQSHISSAAWQEESRLDREKDLELLLQRQEEARKDDQELLKLLGLKAEQQQEAIKTLQRTLDALLAYQAQAQAVQAQDHGQTPPRPESPTSIESPITHPIPVTRFYNVPGPKERSMSLSSDEGIKGHRDFCERALDVLRRHSSASEVGVPDWTITSLEVEHGPRVSSGFFSVVWRGKWRDQDVAIKELNPTTDRTLFINEVDVWRKLKSPHILPFLGASSTTGPPPWFLISPYMKNGNILTYLRSDAGSHADKFALVHQAAQGMQYLHSRDILHGDLKAGNILVTDVGEAVLCDFGLSHLKLDIVTRSKHDGKHSLGGTMRWQSPERLAGSRLTYACDIYAFGMTLFEVFTGQVPFGYVDDWALREAIKNGERPTRPNGMGDDIWTLISDCWKQEPALRPWFAEICERLSKMHTVSTRKQTLGTVTTSNSTSSYTTADEGDIPEQQQALSPQLEARRLPEIEEDLSSSSGSIHSIPTHLEKELSFESDRAERHYRHYLQHSFDDRLTIPLWFPSPVLLGSVGYIRHGQFIKLLDAHKPQLELGNLPPMPYLDEFSSLGTFKTPVNVRSAAEKGLDLITALTTSFVRSSGETKKQAISRRVAVPLKPGMKQAVLIIDDGEFEIYQSFAEAREYLVANIDWILEQFADSHHIGRDDVIMVVGTLKANNYTMLVSNFAPKTTLTFNVHANPEKGKPWGTWAVDKPAPPKGSLLPSQHDIRPMEQYLKYTAKVSEVSASPRDAVMLAKLKFAPGGTEPGLYP